MKKIFIYTFIIFNASFLVSNKANAQYTNLHNFTGTPDGNNPYYGNSLISDGTFLYGMTYGGGTITVGTIFKIMPDGSGYVKLLDFTGATNGRFPRGSLIYNGGFLYGMTTLGGTADLGTIFKIMTDGSGFIKLLDFGGPANGRGPTGSPISDGTFLYGMAGAGGTQDLGSIFKIMPDGSGFVKLYDFMGAPFDGSGPQGSLLAVGASLYGMTYSGGSNDLGTIFKIMTDGSGYVKLLDFTGVANGRNPWGSLITDGTFLYGMTTDGGAGNAGTIFKIMPDGSGYVKLLDFATDGWIPYGDLILDGTTLYGMTAQGGASNMGTIFKIKTDGSGYVNMFSFNGTSNGNYPRGSLISDGTSFYGMAYSDGTNNLGTIFKFQYAPIGIPENNAETNLHVYPNPTTGKINIVCKKEQKQASIEVINMVGQSIISIKNVNLEQGENYLLDISSLDDGTYILKFNNYHTIIVKK